MLDLLKGLFTLTVIGFILYGLLLIGIALLPVILLIVGVAFILFFIKFYRIRKDLEKAMREHKETSFHDAMRRDESGDIIEVEYYEVNDDSEEENSR